MKRIERYRDVEKEESSKRRRYRKRRGQLMRIEGKIDVKKKVTKNE